MRFYFAAVFLSLWLIACRVSAADNECGDWAAKVESVQHNVEIRRSGEGEWTLLRLGDLICLGDSIRLSRFARAEIRLPDQTIVAMDEEAWATFTTPQDENSLWFDVTQGMIYVISRDPFDLKVTTPFIDAGLEGTEFLVRVDGDVFFIIVYEGEVDLESESAQMLVGDQQSISAEAGVFTGPASSVDDRAALDWAQYYPLILDGPLPAPDREIPDSTTDPAAFAARAQARIRVGRIAQARRDIARATSIAQDYPPALAIDAVTALVQGDIELAERQIARALARDLSSVEALLARSYLLLQQNRPRDALAAAELAVASNPANAVVQARYAIVLLSAGAATEAAAAASSALSLNPDLADAHAAAGFVEQANGEHEAAIESFAAAIRLDSATALPRLGQGLALIRLRRLEEGREQIESAVALASNDSVIRSYMGKTYAEELRTELGNSQLDIAEMLNSKDRTAPLYSALLQYAENRPIQALEDLTRASAANGNRFVSRSTFYLDEDLMTRSTSTGQIYSRLGAERQASLIGSHALLVDPADFSAHRVLADINALQARRQLIRVNEAYQARSYQPINVLPFIPQLALANVYIADSVGPAALQHAQVRSGFAQNGLNFQTSAIVGGHDTKGENVVIAGLFDKVSFNLGQFHHESGGFRDNNDILHDAFSAFVQARLSAETSIQLELRSTRVDKGDTMLLFDPERYSRLRRQKEEADSVQLGISHRISTSSQIVGSVALLRGSASLVSGESATANVWGDGGIGEIQFLESLPAWRIVSGLRGVRWNLRELTVFDLVLQEPPFVFQETTDNDSRVRQLSAYVYAHRPLAENLVLTIGGSVESLDGATVSRSARNPKLGVSWHPRPNTYLRFAAFETLQGPVISKQLHQPSLEPMYVAGAGQYWFGTEGESARNYQVGIDHGLTPALQLGVEHTERSIDSSFVGTVLIPGGTLVGSFDVRESIDDLHILWTPTERVAINAGWQYEDFDYHGEASPLSFSRLRTRRVPLEAIAFFGHGLSVSVSGTYIRQNGLFSGSSGPGIFSPGNSRFWTFDASVDYRLPGRRGSVELGIRNLFDDDSQFQDTDPENPHIFPERLAFARFSLSY